MKMTFHSQQSKWSVGPERTLPLFAQQCKQVGSLLHLKWNIFIPVDNDNYFVFRYDKVRNWSGYQM